MKKKILIVDDEEDLIEMLRYHLVKNGYDVVKAYDGDMAIDILKRETVHLMILDVMMPGKDGYEVCQMIRSEGDQTPIIFLTARTEEIDEVLGLEIGGDDFIRKPFSIKSLISRVRAVLRRYEEKESNENILSIQGIEIHLNNYDIFIDEKNINFTKKEFELITYLAKNPNKVYSRDELLNQVWGDNVYVVNRTVDVHIGRIRKKLGRYRDIIETIVGVGYRCNI
jgi:two-component system alkaline phosphatase synthesis response regulator PhoP